MNICKQCRKELDEGKFCSKECYRQFLKEKTKKHGNRCKKEWNNLSNENHCIQCGKIMDIDRISAYCEECEKHIEIKYDSLQY